MSQAALSVLAWSVFVFSCYSVLWICWRMTFLFARSLFHAERVGTVVERGYSSPKEEDVWLPPFLTSVDTPGSTWVMDPPIMVHRRIPSMAYVRIRFPDGSHVVYTCTEGEYEAWAEGARARVDVYSVLGWTFYTSSPRPA